MATAAIPPLEATAGLSPSKASATSAITPGSAAAARPQPPSRSSTPQVGGARRGPGRPAPSDFLSERATTAFIRRTLCAQHPADRGRNTPAPIGELLPPLTSRNDVDLHLYALISVILREYVQNWYNKITPDETFVAEIVQIIAHCTRALEQRLRTVDLESLLFDELPELLHAHIRAYRIAKSSAARPPIEANHRDIYHSLCPLPALSPVPKADVARTVQTQAENEAAYRQLLVQGVLALLLPTEDLQNECLTSLVGQIFSELIIGNLVTNKLSEPWLLLEIFIILTRLAKRNHEPTGTSRPPDAVGPKDQAPPRDQESLKQPARRRRAWAVDQIFWSVVQWGFLLFNTVRVIIITMVSSRNLPPRAHPLFNQKPAMSGRFDEKSSKPLAGSRSIPASLRVPVVDFKLWPCVAELLEVDVRMPWLSGGLSMMQWSAMTGPGRIAGYNGVLDR
ncbi:hypothetical protein JX265_009569 [Neoarthrinium moseri]|uniref:PXA domain-containing protein n=1 Tax=Neoarthrinium moseri TaxID=1658444 RepID=A0A9P9WG87_9PEZI|nr:hypothetical protein JX265_009569 [Neoarthrinium moseri]